MILLLSDLHLPADRPGEPSPLREGFLRFLQGPAREATAVYLLGDIFEAWIGDDAGLVDYAPEIRALRQLTDAGIPVYFIAGNRDFLVGSGFSAATGVQRLQDPSVLRLGGVPTLLAHGDAYCSADRAYQRWRRFSRHRRAQQCFAWLPPSLRRRIAGGLRQQSREATPRKPLMITDVVDTAIAQALHEAGVTRLIHGHTHRPATHRWQAADGRQLERIVLPDWRADQRAYIAIDASGGISTHQI